jgi:hypothetical protein
VPCTCTSCIVVNFGFLAGQNDCIGYLVVSFTSLPKPALLDVTSFIVFLGLKKIRTCEVDGSTKCSRTASKWHALSCPSHDTHDADFLGKDVVYHTNYRSWRFQAAFLPTARVIGRRPSELCKRKSRTTFESQTLRNATGMGICRSLRQYGTRMHTNWPSCS